MISLGSAALLDLLADAVSEAPVLVVVDDVHWLDRPSVDAIVFAARRLGAERVAMILAVREGTGASPRRQLRSETLSAPSCSPPSSRT